MAPDESLLEAAILPSGIRFGDWAAPTGKVDWLAARVSPIRKGYGEPSGSIDLRDYYFCYSIDTLQKPVAIDAALR